MSKVRVFYEPNGIVTLVHLVSQAKKPDETDTEALNRIIAEKPNSFGPQYATLDYDDLDKALLPLADIEYAKAWRGAKGVGVWCNTTEKDKIIADKDKETKIKDKLRDMAIKELEKDGEL